MGMTSSIKTFPMAIHFLSLLSVEIVYIVPRGDDR
jgi:hypothetical protein